ncbi:hypothetical protein [Marmoricola sp. URHB0036]|uniref:hypothetical protein n=1 Tax=Marmoricola sp. URHB0036 TaxID=1298863 RepID=UPI00042634CA|nr:hypothetical protein [Marmoricola sp. URHB0036]
MIDSALVLPSPRALLPELSETDPVPELRAACAAALDILLADGPDRLVVLAPPVSDLNRARGVVDPVGHRIARHLLGEHDFEAQVALPYEAASLVEHEDVRSTAVIVMADGSACRGEKAPGHLHPEAIPFDDAIECALRTGDVDALAGIDPSQAHELWCEGAAGFHVLAEIARGRQIATDVSYADAPHGVAWWVARWDLA